MAAINRFQTVIEQYQTTTHVPEALHRLTESYLALGMTDEAQASAAVLGYNFPGSEWYQRSYALLQRQDLEPKKVRAPGSAGCSERGRAVRRMLKSLAIRDIVLIERLELGFGGGLSALTGETGAGKSIILDALGLALGGRSDRPSCASVPSRDPSWRCWSQAAPVPCRRCSMSTRSHSTASSSCAGW